MRAVEIIAASLRRRSRGLEPGKTVAEKQKGDEGDGEYYAGAGRLLPRLHPRQG